MANVTRSALSILDYEEIWDYIAKDDSRAADRLISAFEQKLRLLATMPALGKGEFDLAPNLRSFPVGNYLLFYREVADGIQLVRALHGARDIASAYFGEE